MLLTLSLSFYSAMSGATFARLTQFYDLIERPDARVRWLLFSLVAALLWPLTLIVLLVISWLARREANLLN